MNAETLTRDFFISNDHGLHARPGAYLVQVVRPFRSEITISNSLRPDNRVSARSLLKLLSLGIRKGHTVHIHIHGDDAAQAMQALETAFHHRLGE